MFWSSRSERIFRRCKREYFYTYLASQGGHEETARPELRQIHLLKNLIFGASYIDVLMGRALRKIFYSPTFDADEEDEREGKASPLESIFLRSLLRSFHLDRNAIARGDFLVDHKTPLIFEIYYGIGDIASYFDELERELKKRWSQANDGGLFVTLATISPEYRVWLDSPLVIEFGGRKFFVSPILCWRDGRKMCYLLTRQAPEDMTLLLYYSLHKSMLRPDLVDFYCLAEGKMRKLSPVNLSESIDKINHSYDEIAEFRCFTVEPPEKIDDRERCLKCRFWELCLI